MRIAFFGAGEFGLPTLEALASSHQVAAVISQPDRPSGRQQKLTPTPIAQFALSRGLQVMRMDNVNQPGFIQQMQDLQLDASVVIAFGQKLSPEVIAQAGELVINLHASLLPKYRGAAPINWAMLQGERETGLSVISLAQRMDAGLIYGQSRTPIDPHETAGELHDRLAKMGPALVEQVLGAYQSGTLAGAAQDETQACRAPKLSKADGWVDWNQPAEKVAARIHALTPWPGIKVRWERPNHAKTQELFLRRVEAAASTSSPATPPIPPGTLLDYDKVAVASGWIRLLEVQTPGGRVMTLEEFRHGHALQKGDQLASAPPASI